MKTHAVTLALTVRAATPADALEIAQGAAEHLRETFNDDESLQSVHASAVPDLADRAAAALRALLTACERIQAEQPARRFLAPTVAAEVHALADALCPAGATAALAGAQRVGLAADDAHAEAAGLALAQLFRLPRIRTGPDAGRYRTTTGTKTPQGLARTVARVLEETAPTTPETLAHPKTR